MDSDDMIDKSAMMLLSEKMDTSRLDMLCFNTAAFGEDLINAKYAGSITRKRQNRTLNENTISTGLEFFIALKRDNSYVPTAWSSMVSHSFFLNEELWFHPGILHEDEAYTFIAMVRAKRVTALNRILYFHRLRPGSIMSSDVTIARAYGAFCAATDIQKEIRNMSTSEDDYSILIEHVNSLYRNAARKYARCSEDEKMKVSHFPQEDRTRFETSIIPIAKLIQENQLLKEENRIKQQESRRLKKQRKELEEKQKKLENRQKQLVNKKNSLEHSLSYRIGRAVTWVPRKLRDGMQQSAKEINADQGQKSRKNQITILPSEITGNRITYNFTVSGDWSQFFREKNSFTVSYPFNLEEIPESIRIIPFLVQVLPVAWILDAQISVPTCDKDFVDSLEKVRSGYQKMYPMLEFKENLHVHIVQKNLQQCAIERPIICFSGGIDAISTTLSWLEFNPLLAGLWGADVPWKDEDAWSKVEGALRESAQTLNLELMVIRTAFRDLLNEGKLQSIISNTGDNWWHGFQHGIGVLGHMAPTAWHEHCKTVIIASSFTVGDVYTCASDPSIDNHLRYCGVRVVHDGYEKSRQDKIQSLATYCRTHGLFFRLHVCWEKRDGRNCCHCEKCWRTMIGLWLEDEDPRDFGFSQWNGIEGFTAGIEQNFKKFRKQANVRAAYKSIQERMREKFSEHTCPEELRWFYDADLRQISEGKLSLHDGKLYEDAWLLGTPEHTNLGDHCIVSEEITYMQRNYPLLYIRELSSGELKQNQYRQMDEILPSQLVLLPGGGNLGTLWPDSEKTREAIISRLRENRIVIFPQSIFFSDDEDGNCALEQAKEIYQGDRILLCCRDKASYVFAQKNFKCRSILLPDTVMWGSLAPSHHMQRFGVMTIFRSDKERVLDDEATEYIMNLLTKKFHCIDEGDTCLQKGTIITKDIRANLIQELVDRIAQAECVVTDRLHGMILSAVTGTPCVVFDNSYHKIGGCYEWIRGLDYIQFIQDKEELETAITQVCSSRQKEYPHEKMRNAFLPLTEGLKKQG